MRNPISLALLGLPVVVHAFYPYHLPTTELSSSSSRFKTRDIHSWSFPLRRVPIKRANTHQIIQADQPSAPNSTGINQDGFDTSYMIELDFGPNKKMLNLLLDTAAVNTWIMSSDCKSQTCASHNTYGSADSSTLKFDSKSFSVAYGSGNVAGTVVTDTVTILGSSFPLTFGLASNVSNDFSSYSMDGIVGFGRVDKDTFDTTGVGAPTLMDTLVSQGIIKVNLFGIRLSRASDGQKNGEINFGQPDSSAYSGSLNYISTVSNNHGFWEIPLDKAQYDGKTASIQSGVTVLLDSGTTLMLIPPSDAQAIHNLIDGSAKNGADAYSIPCSTNKVLSFTFGGTAYTISPKDYVGTVISGSTCNSNIVGRTTFGSAQWLIGDVFLKNVYTVFDADGNRVGLAPLVGASKDATASSPEASAASSSSSASHTPQVPGSTMAASDSGGNHTTTSSGAALPAAMAPPSWTAVVAVLVSSLFAFELVA